MPDTEFNIMAPQRHQQAIIGTDNKILVTVQDFCSHTYSVQIYYFPFNADSSRELDGPAVTFPVSGSYSSRIAVDTTELADDPYNRFIQVIDNENSDTQCFAFKATFPSSSSSSGSKTEVHQIKFCKEGQVVPHAVILKLSSKVTRGTCAKCADLNKPAVLLHSNDAGCAGSWYSRPIAFCGREQPGYWVLERASATSWALVLKQETKVLVTYIAKTKRLDCSLPITLQKKGAGSKACKDWPKNVTISPAE